MRYFSILSRDKDSNSEIVLQQIHEQSALIWDYFSKQPLTFEEFLGASISIDERFVTKKNLKMTFELLQPDVLGYI